jgi:hypothetical protein
MAQLNPQLQLLANAINPGANVAQPQYLQQARYSTVFGIVNIDAPGAGVGGIGQVTLPQAPVLQNYIQRELGITKKVASLGRLSDALNNPRLYLQRKQADLIRIGNESAGRFGQTYTNLVAQGESDEYAQKEALKQAKEIQSQEMVKHRLEFPKEISKSLYDKLV